MEFEFQTKRKILKAYGKGLVELAYSSAELNAQVNPGATFLGTLKCNLKFRLEKLADNYPSKNQKYILEGMTQELLERGQTEHAYNVCKIGNEKKADLIKKLLSPEFSNLSQ